MEALVRALADAIWPPFVFSILIGLPSVVLYLLELATVFRHWRRFNSSFFVLFVVRAISHTINYFASFLYQRFGKLGIFIGLLNSLPSPVLNTLFFANFYFFHVENLANFFLLLNRLSAVLFLINYGKLWNYAIPFAVAIIFLLPFSVTAHIFELNVFMSYDDANQTFTFNYTYPSHYKQWPLLWRKGNTFLSMVSAVSFMAICLAIQLFTISVMRWKAGKAAAEIANGERAKLERRMTIYALVTFLGQLIMALYMILQYVIASAVKHDSGVSEAYRLAMIVATQNQFCWVNDLCTVALPAWLLLWASGTLRAKLQADLAPVLGFFFIIFGGGGGGDTSQTAAAHCQLQPPAPLWRKFLGTGKRRATAPTAVLPMREFVLRNRGRGGSNNAVAGVKMSINKWTGAGAGRGKALERPSTVGGGGNIGSSRRKTKANNSSISPAQTISS